MNIRADIKRISSNNVPNVGLVEGKFLRNIINGKMPFVFKVDWPAISKWNPEYISKIAGNEEVSVSMSVDESSAPTNRQKMKLSDYVDIITGLDQKRDETPQSVPYLKQFDILSARPQLLGDLDFSFLQKGRKEIAFWFGTRFSVTGLHCDPNDGVLAQIYGSKRIYLFSPDQRELLYPNDKYDPATECCEADAHNPNYNAHPRFREARGLIAEISKGEALYIPSGWFHQVVGLETNISVNCFFFSHLEFYTTEIVSYRLPKWLHDHGLYRRGNCVCHAKGS